MAIDGFLGIIIPILVRVDCTVGEGDSTFSFCQGGILVVLNFLIDSVGTINILDQLFDNFGDVLRTSDVVDDSLIDFGNQLVGILMGLFDAVEFGGKLLHIFISLFQFVGNNCPSIFEWWSFCLPDGFDGGFDDL